MATIGFELVRCSDVRIGSIEMKAEPGSVVIKTTDSTGVYVGEILADLSGNQASHYKSTAKIVSSEATNLTYIIPEIPECASAPLTVEVLKSGAIRINGRKACPCGSLKQFKNCHGSYMSTGIKSDNSVIKIGKATIIAEKGVDAKNNSDISIDTFLFVESGKDAVSLLKLLNLPDNIPQDVVQETVAVLTESRTLESFEGSRLKEWLLGNGYDPAYWTSLVVQFGLLLAS